MKIGVIGTGSMGDVIIRKLTAAGHQVKIANSRGAETVAAYAREVGTPSGMDRYRN
jgi:8-hydroxy-5-deazaflavin:NADPH oxidoreductase